MVANLTRYSACTVHPDTPEKPVPQDGGAPVAEQRTAPVPKKADPTGDEPVRLFVWASA